MRYAGNLALEDQPGRVQNPAFRDTPFPTFLKSRDSRLKPHMVDSLKRSMESYAAEIERADRRTLDAYSQLGEGCPDRLREAIRYSLLAPGNGLRPMLGPAGGRSLRRHRRGGACPPPARWKWSTPIR